MAKGSTIVELQSARKARGLTMDEAAALIVVDGKPATRPIWHSWERGKKIPREKAMIEIGRVFGVQPNAFYPRPDGAVQPEPPAQAALAF